MPSPRLYLVEVVIWIETNMILVAVWITTSFSIFIVSLLDFLTNRVIYFEKSITKDLYNDLLCKSNKTYWLKFTHVDRVLFLSDNFDKRGVIVS